MRKLLLVVLIATVLVLGTIALATAAPLNAGTAPGTSAIGSKTYAGGAHYLLGGSKAVGRATVSGSHAKPFNGSLAYSQWPDRAQVSGRKAAMSCDIVFAGSKQRSATATIHAST